ncbi:hypothetical protein BGY98DRAFT_299623 [Russula aff. rugulosa BPL654]|nr:hypothetical protein BGY98DRAFT_299623 [Russula aff. rugulosa BPL654]
MLLYPLAYSLVVLPISIPQWLKSNHPNVPSAAMFFGNIMFYLSGAINVLLFLMARPHLLLFPDLRNSPGQTWNLLFKVLARQLSPTERISNTAQSRRWWCMMALETAQHYPASVLDECQMTSNHLNTVYGRISVLY